MKTLLFLLLPFLWTQAQAYEYDRPGTVELTYEDLAHELAQKRKQPLLTQRQGLLNPSSSEWSIGFAFSQNQYHLSDGSKSFNQSGLDFRWTQSFHESPLKLEGSAKSFGSASSGRGSADTKSLGAMAKYQAPLPDNISFVLGVGTSLNFIQTKDSLQSRSAQDWALTAGVGLKGPITQRLSWGLEMQAASPLTSHTLKGGLETSLLISSSL